MKKVIAIMVMAAAATAMAQQANTLDTYKQAYEKQLQALHVQYAKALDTIIADVKRKGDLDSLLILQDEQNRFDAQKSVPAPRSAKDSFRPASEAYCQAMVALLGRYVKALDGLIKTEVTADRIQEAMIIKAEKEKAAVLLADLQTKLPGKAVGELPANHRVEPQQSQRSAFDRGGAAFRVFEGAKVKDLKKGCILYTDKDYAMKERPRQLASQKYVAAPFCGCTVVCEKDGVAFALGLFDSFNQGQTDAAKSYLAKKEWTKIEDIPTLVLFYTNGADRMGEVYWKEIKKGEELSFPAGMILCYKTR